MFKKTSIFIYSLTMIVVVAVCLPSLSQPVFKSQGKAVKMNFSRGVFTVYDFPSKKAETSAVLVFGSGDGGWGPFEEAISLAFQNQGVEVIGVDSKLYAATDYDLDILQRDYGTISGALQAPFDHHPPPLIVGGYSMGAAQAIAVAGGRHPPPGLVGVLLVDPCSRGRFGLRSSDQMDFLPTGPGTFAVTAFSDALAGLRVVQWHASDDTIDSHAWLDSLKAEHRLFTFPNNGHYYDVNRDDFLRQLVASAEWITAPRGESPMAAKTKMDP